MSNRYKDYGGRRPRKRTGLKIVLFLLLIFFLVAFAGAGYMYSKLRMMNYDSGVFSASESNSAFKNAYAASGLNIPSGKLNSHGDVFNVLMLGTDVKIEGTKDPGRSDSIMLFSLNKNTGKIKLVSFERGITVPVPADLAFGKTSDLLTHAYRWAGPEYMVSTIENCFLTDVDGFAQVDVNAFADIVDAIGGIDVELSDAEVYGMTSGEGVPAHNVVVPGVNHLDGHDAMAYCRLRSIDSDWNRQERQRNAVKACIARMKAMSPTELDNLVNTIMPMINTNISASQITALLLNASKILNSGEIEQLQVPDKNPSVSCNFDYESKKISNFLYKTNYELTIPY